MTRRTHRRPRAVVAAALASLVVLGGCTLSGDEDPPTPSTTDGAAPTADAAPEPSAEPSPDGPSPEELSAELFASAPQPVGPDEVLGSQTVTIDDVFAPEPYDITVDVLEIRRVTDATLVTIQLSSPVEGQSVGPDALTGSTNSEFFNAFGLDDTTEGLRYRALSWRRGSASDGDAEQQPANSCICPYKQGNLALGSYAMVMDSLHGPLPEDLTTVTFTGPNGVSIPDLPVTPQDG